MVDRMSYGQKLGSGGGSKARHFLQHARGASFLALSFLQRPMREFPQTGPPPLVGSLDEKGFRPASQNDSDLARINRGRREGSTGNGVLPSPFVSDAACL
jgi:hypothetical protein